VRSIIRLTFGFLALFIFFVTVAPLTALATTPTPSVVTTSWAGVPSPADCVVNESATADSIVDSLRTPVAGAASIEFPLTIPAESDLPRGETPTKEQVDAVSAVIWNMVACINGGNYAGFFGEFTGPAISVFFGGIFVALGRAPGPFTEKELTELHTNMTASLAASPVPVADEEHARIDAIRDVRLLPDGRILLLVDGTVGTDATIYVVMTLVEERWMIDAIGQIGVFPA